MGCVTSRRKNNDGKENNSNVKHLDNLNSTNKPIDNGINNNLPEPRPPKRQKKDVLPDVSVLRHIDEHVMKTPRYAERSIEALGEYLTKPATNDLEKVRAFYKWITENIRYDTDEYFGGTTRTRNKTPESLLSSKSSVCEGYASIFQLLCNYAGIPVKKISGHSKGYSYEPGFNFTKDTPTNHAWNAVYINEEWRFIETTWGAGSLGNNKQFVKNCTDFYFLTDPDLFIIDHFPYFDNDEIQSSKWQLLRKPISLEIFNKRIKSSRHAREWGLTFSSHPNTVIEIDKTVDIVFHAKVRMLDDVNVKLFDSCGRNKDQYAMVKKHSRTFTVTICPNAIGEYRLEIYGAVGTDTTTLDGLINYVIKCNSVSENLYPLPRFDSCYGPVENCTERGFENVAKLPVSVTSKTGELSFPIKIKEGTNVIVALKNSDDVKLVQYTLLEMDKQLRLKARFPQKGYYRLVIFSQFNSESYTPAINILVYNLKEPTVSCPFPQTYPETVKYKCSLYEPLGQEVPPNTMVRFRFSSLVISEALLMREVVPKKAIHSWDTIIKTPPYGEVRISGKKENETTSWLMYSFKVK